MTNIIPIRVAQRTILDEMNNPIDGVRFFFRIDGLPDIYHVDVPQADANGDSVREAAEEFADGILEMMGKAP